jgi:hypothetical protein
MLKYLQAFPRTTPITQSTNQILQATQATQATQASQGIASEKIKYTNIKMHLRESNLRSIGIVHKQNTTLKPLSQKPFLDHIIYKLKYTLQVT